MKKLILLAIMLNLANSGCVNTHKTRLGKAQITPHRVAKVVEQIIADTDPNVNIGIRISSLKSNETIYEKNSGRHFMPASTIKLVTLASALHYLGPSYRFYTTIFTDSFADKEGIVKNLYIQGSGDPSLMDYDLVNLASELKQMGIHKIEGGIFVDDQIFDDVLWGRGTMWEDRQSGFAAPISGLTLNYNRLLIKTSPSFQNGEKARVVVRPMCSYTHVTSSAKTTKDGSGRNMSLTVERGKERTSWPETTNDGLHAGDKVIVSGQIAKNSEPFYHKVAIHDPGIMAATFLKDQLMHLGIKVHGNVARMAVPPKAIRLATHESRSLAEALIDFTKISNNIATDALVKTIAAQSGIRPASFSAGLKLINDFLVNQVGFSANSVVTADGAGQSRYNLITPEQLVKLLTYAANHFHMGPEFMAALTFVGEDGLMRFRLNAPSLRGLVRAKSGTLAGVSSLAGYLNAENGERYAFAIMINGFIGSSAKYLRMQDQIMATMLGADQDQLANIK